MESLYRKYRPQTFADVVGQQHVVATLEHAIQENRTSHAYLFCGPRGTGKTTMARLLAKALMCEQGPGHLPDGTCAQCALIAAGEHPDVYELDAASRTGVDNVREEIINSVGYAPTHGRYKMYIIDEVHMLTTAAFNALLKTLEEPPDHVVFVLCTTDPQKIPATILSRVQRFDFRPIGNDDIRRHLAHVCEEEGFTYEDAALDLVTVNARGGMRDALSTLEQLSVFGGGVIGLEAAQDLLGAVSGSALQQVVTSLAARDVAALFVQVGDLVNAGRDLLQFTRELAAHMRDVYVVAAVGAKPAALPAGTDVERLRSEAAAFGSVDRLGRVLALLGDVSREMATAPNQRLVLEIAITRMARPEVDLTLESLAERVEALELRIARLEEQGASQVASAAQQPAKAVPVEQKRRTAQEESARNASYVPAPKAPNPPQQTKAAPSEPAVAQQAPVRQQAPQGPAQHTPAQAAAEPAAQPAPQRPPQRPATTQPAPQPAPNTKRPAQNRRRSAMDSGSLQRSWRQVVSALMANVPARGTLLSSAVATQDDGDTLVVGLPKGSSFALKMLERPDIRSLVESYIVQVFGPRAVVFKEGTDSNPQSSYKNSRPTQASTASQRPAGFGRPGTSAYAPQPSPYAEQANARPARQSNPFARNDGAQTRQVTPNTQDDATASYPMPWDEPSQQVAASVSPRVQQPAQTPEPTAPSNFGEPFYEEVPYEELGTWSQDYEPDMPYEQDSRTQRAAQQPAPQPPQPASRAAQRPAPQPAPQPTQQPAPQAATAPQSVPVAPEDLPPELARVLSDAFEVFGEDTQASMGA